MPRYRFDYDLYDENSDLKVSNKKWAKFSKLPILFFTRPIVHIPIEENSIFVLINICDVCKHYWPEKK